jgi:polysaccharide biosynthesis transport protein
MNLLSQTANGRNATLTDDLTPGQTLNLDFASAYPVGSLTTSRPRASLAAHDAFRTLALTIETLVGDLPIRSIALLSALPGEGRSLSAELLSLAFSESSPPVRMIDADPFQDLARQKSRHRLRMGRKHQTQAARAEEKRIERDSCSTVSDVPAFERVPVARDAYPGRREFLDDVRRAIDAAVALQAKVLVDAPACSLSSIAFSVAQMVDAVLYVVRPDQAAVETHREVLAQLRLLNVNVLGILLNEG